MLSMVRFSAQVPDYFGNKPIWHTSAWEANFYDGYWSMTEDLYYIGGDTIISGRVYSKIFKRGGFYDENDVLNYWVSGKKLPPLKIQYDYDVGKYVRQENRTIKIINAGETQEKLLIRYDYNIGDTIKEMAFFEDGLGCYFNDTIEKIDSILVGNSFRRKFYTSYGHEIIEGIGNMDEIDFVSGNIFFNSGCRGIDFG